MRSTMNTLVRGLAASFLMLILAAEAAAQQTSSTSAKLQGFPSAEAAADALATAVRNNDDKAVAAMLGPWWRDFVPTGDNQAIRDRATFLAAWAENHKVTTTGDKAVVEVGKTGWTLPVPIVKDGAEWRFDVGAGVQEMVDREIGRNEFGAIQTLMAIVDAERDYADMDPMKAGAPAYARRLLSSPGRRPRGSSGRGGHEPARCPWRGRTGGRPAIGRSAHRRTSRSRRPARPGRPRPA